MQTFLKDLKGSSSNTFYSSSYTKKHSFCYSSLWWNCPSKWWIK